MRTVARGRWRGNVKWLLLLVTGYFLGAYVRPIVNSIRSAAGISEPDPAVIETTPDLIYACVVTRQRFYPPDFYTFTIWYLDPHTHRLLFPVGGDSEVVRENIEEGPPTDDIRLHWDGDRLRAGFFWPDGAESGVLVWNKDKKQTWEWSIGGLARPTTRAALPTSQP